MNTSEQVDELLPALMRAKANFPPILFDSTNPHFKNQFASLGQILEAVTGPLADEELILIHGHAAGEPGHLHMTATLFHASGQFLETWVMMPLAKIDPQGYGSATTYARRYATEALLGLKAKDDDGERATRRTETITPGQLKKLNTLGVKHFGDEWDDKRHEAVTKMTKGQSSSSRDLTTDQASRLIERIQSLIDGNGDD